MLDGDDAPHDQLVADIVQCGDGDCKALRIDSLDGWRTHTKVQVVDFIGLTGLARRTGRFPQLVDPRSGVNGLLLTGSPRFREVSLEIDAAFAGSSTLRR